MGVEGVELKIGDSSLYLETGRVAKQALGSCILRYGDTVLLSTVCAAKKEGTIDFMPLTVEFRERSYAMGKIPGGFFKREGKPSSEAILAARLIDRPIRPLFDDDFRDEVQIIITPLAIDLVHSPQALGVIAASTALMLSGLPFFGPVGAVRMGKIGDRFIVNVHDNDLERSEIDLFVAGTKDAITMVEAGAKEVSEDVLLEAIKIAHKEIKRICELQEELKSKFNVKVYKYERLSYDSNLEKELKDRFSEKIKEAVKIFDKLERQKALNNIEEEAIDEYSEKYNEDEWQDKKIVIKQVFEKLIKEQVRLLILNEGFRADGRGVKDIRPIECMIDVLPRVHGSSLFTRGQTQSLGIVTLGSSHDAQMIDTLGMEEFKKFMLHYNFPPYSVGEVRPLRGPGRREIGHGALAERALLPVMPDEEEFPYTVRAVSEILESNGSSSMATVCSASLALMDAGVPIKKHVSGIAMGLIKEGEKWIVLTDIQGLEDHYGDMDFKVAGTRDGITALQMDIKISGLDFDIMKQALDQAKEARLFILQKMEEVIKVPRKELSPHAPRITTISINPDKVKYVIGPGGKMIKKIIEETGVEIDIEDDGVIHIYAVDNSASEKAKEMIREITADIEVGKVYVGRVTRIMKFGAFVEILPGKEGLVHISQLDTKRVNKVEDIVNIGDKIEVEVTDIDQMGRINLSRKAILKK